MTTTRLTMAQALVKFLDNQYIEVDGVQSKFVAGVFSEYGASPQNICINFSAYSISASLARIAFAISHSSSNRSCRSRISSA